MGSRGESHNEALLRSANFYQRDRKEATADRDRLPTLTLCEMASISADLGRPPLSIPAELHSQGACHTVSSHCSEGVPASLVDDAEHPDSGILSSCCLLDVLA